MNRKATFHSESGRWHVTEGQDTIACVYSCGDYRKERAEAHVMAAAQELLQLAIYAVDNSEFDSEEFDRMARAAITKATKRV